MKSQIMNIASGNVNVVNDGAIGMSVVPQGTGLSPYGGQLGKTITLDDSMLKFKSAVGTVYGGDFQYVRLAAAAAATVLGQIVFWDVGVADNLYQVTTSETESTDAAV